jgi:hypothetical protein
MVETYRDGSPVRSVSFVTFYYTDLTYVIAKCVYYESIKRELK